ncbi:MAG TPA: hypothetical protein VFU28_24245 [Vicinamibacterales bacterium]|nr:hypothetical protein [Vicinamibacterales bacterium]
MAKKFGIVTGASSGIGYELAAICARDRKHEIKGKTTHGQGDGGVR